MPKAAGSDMPSREQSAESAPAPTPGPEKGSSALSRQASKDLPTDVTIITPLAHSLIAKLRERFPELQPSSPLYSRFDDVYLNRFLRARKYNLEEIVIMIRDHLAWYKNFGVAEISRFEFTEINEFRTVYPHGYHGVDKTGRPVYIERYSKMNADYLYKISTLERVSKYWVKGYEHLLYDRFPACSTNGRKISQSCVILDLAGIKLSMFDSRAREFLRTVSKISSDNYPETLGVMFVVNVPSFFSILYSVAKPLIPPDTKKKIHVVTSKHTKEELLKFIDADQLPNFLGGDCICDLSSKTDDRGCLCSDRGPWKNENDEDFVSIPDHEVHESRSFISAADPQLAPRQMTMGSLTDPAERNPKKGSVLKCSFCCH